MGELYGLVMVQEAAAAEDAAAAEEAPVPATSSVPQVMQAVLIDEILGSYTTSAAADDIVTISKDNDGLVTITKKNGGSSSNRMSAAEFTANRKLHYLPYNITGDFKNNTITWSNGTTYSKMNVRQCTDTCVSGLVVPPSHSCLPLPISGAVCSAAVSSTAVSSAAVCPAAVCSVAFVPSACTLSQITI